MTWVDKVKTEQFLKKYCENLNLRMFIRKQTNLRKSELRHQKWDNFLSSTKLHIPFKIKNILDINWCNGLEKKKCVFVFVKSYKKKLF